MESPPGAQTRFEAQKGLQPSRLGEDWTNGAIINESVAYDQFRIGPGTRRRETGEINCHGHRTTHTSYEAITILQTMVYSGAQATAAGGQSSTPEMARELRDTGRWRRINRVFA